MAKEILACVTRTCACNRALQQNA